MVVLSWSTDQGPEGFLSLGRTVALQREPRMKGNSPHYCVCACTHTHPKPHMRDTQGKHALVKEMPTHAPLLKAIQ